MDYNKLSRICDSSLVKIQDFMSAPNRLFESIEKRNGVEVEKSQGDTSVGAPYERRDGRVWTLATKYTVNYNGKSKTFDIACLSNEGYDPDYKTGWREDRNGKKWYVGKSFGWILNGGPKQTWREIATKIKNSLSEIGL